MELRGGSSYWHGLGGTKDQRCFLLELAAGPVKASQPTTALGKAMLEL